MNGSIRRQKVITTTKVVSNLSINTRSVRGMYYTEVDVSDMIPSGYKIGAVTMGYWGDMPNNTITVYTSDNRIGVFAQESITIGIIYFEILLCRS